MFAAIRRASSRVSGFVFSLEHLGGPVEKSALWLMDREHPDHICLSCGKAMHLARTIPGIGEPPALRTYANARHVESYLRKGAGRGRGHEN
jgi:hypothetical protein